MNRIFLQILVLCVATIFATSCSSHKKAMKAASSVDTQLAVPVNDNWTDLYMPVTLSLQSPQSLSMSGRATMQRDQSIHISLRMLGFEVAVLYATNDSVFAVDKYHKYYYAESLRRVMAGKDITIGMLQDLLLGSNVAIADVPVDIATNSAGLIEKILLSMPGDKVASCTYSDMYQSDKGTVPQLVEINVPLNAKTTVKGAIEWKIKDCKWDSGRSPEWKSPGKGYKRLSNASISNMFKL